ncbi:hypothetical protein C9374_003538 [Naegleria lovaniensis]|uniref:Protein kinase domain-containing protein n=1 Tax=Naegleria lovaniensis TaxID=51637 RepID=A0AA88GTG8_NAELO|nr:uncharacterized protein C9374_003538 [Naegleria lovaniensis]KAG2385723.1 hypothetical protein C9374_003538 [Naegleria lovaniensis]
MGQVITTQFQQACDEDNVEACRNLLLTNEGRELFKYEFENSRTLLMVAVRSGATKIVRMLFTDFRDRTVSMIDHVDWAKYTALHWACWIDHVEIVKILIENGANDQMVNEEGKRAIDMCNYGKKTGETFDYLNSMKPSFLEFMKKALQPTKYNHSSYKPGEKNEDYTMKDLDDGFVEIEKLDYSEISSTDIGKKNPQQGVALSSFGTQQHPMFSTLTKQQMFRNITQSFRGGESLVNQQQDSEFHPLENLSSRLRCTSLDSIELGNFVGKGGEGRVYSGRWKKSQVAIKVISHPYMTRTLANHLDLIMNISNSYCIPHHAYAYDSENSKLYIVMEKMDCSLWEFLIENKKHLSVREKVEILLCISKGMFYLHDMKPPILHLDLKLENILMNIGQNGKPSHVKLTDFGLAQFKTTDLLVLDCPLGTLRAISPEILRSGECSEKCDVYSFGILMYELLFSKVAYVEEEDTNDGNEMILMAVANQNKRPTIPLVRDLYCDNEQELSIFDKLLRLMQDCWAGSASERPNFDNIISTLEKLLL